MSIQKKSILTCLLLLLCLLTVFPVWQSDTAYGASLPSATGKITEPDGVNIRRSYTTSSAILGTIPYNGSFTVNGEKFTTSGSTAPDTVWYSISSVYGNGYIRSDLASVSYSSYLNGTTTDSVNARRGAGTSYKAVTVLNRGATVRIIASAEAPDGSSWYKIDLDGEYLYLSSAYVSAASGGSTSQPSGTVSDEAFEQSLEEEGFPESYRVYLRALHEKHPNWKFKANHVGFSFADALEKQAGNVNANLVSITYPDAFKAVQSGTYDFSTHSYVAKDGPTWVAASKEAVAYYMDPRNWLTESYIFTFEDLTYDPSVHTEDIVQKVLQTTAMPKGASSYFMQAASQTYNGKAYSVSPVYLAAKARIELGSSDFMINGHSFTYGGKTYSGYYNAYNIGAVDSADGSAALKGLVYAAGGADGSGTSYLRPWNTLEKAIKGGAIYIAQNFISNNQHTSYYERYNVLNGLSSIATHQYQTSIYAPSVQGQIVYDNYSSFGVLDEAFTFDIPVYENMPQEVCKRPPDTGNNNCYLDDIRLFAGEKELDFTKSFNRFTGTYTVKTEVGASVKKLTVETDKNAEDSVVSVSGTSLSEGENVITVKCTSSSGLATMTYRINVTKNQSGDGEATDPEDSSELISGVENTTIDADISTGTGYIRLDWTKSAGYDMDAFEVFRSTDPDSFGSKAYFTTKSGTSDYYKNTKELTKGTTYYFKIRGKRVIDGKTYYSKWSDVVSITYGEEPNQGIISGVENTTIDADISTGTGYIRLDWTKSAGYDMDAFEVFRSTDPDSFGSKAYFTTKSGTSDYYKNTKELTKGTTYYFKIRGKRVIDGKTYYSKWSDVVSITYGEEPNQGIISGVENTTIKASATAGAGYIRIDWTKSAGYKVDFYEVFRSTDPDSFGSKPYFTTKSGTSDYYKNTKELTKGTTYYFKIRGKRVIDGKTYYSKWSDVVSITYGEEPNQGIISGVENTTIDADISTGTGYIRLDWTKSAGYDMDAFEVFRSTDPDSFGSKAYFTTKSGTSDYYKNTKELTKGTTYYFKIRGKRVIDGKTYYSKWSDVVSITYGEEPNQGIISGVENTTIKASATAGAGYIRIDWTKSAGYKVDFYEVFRSTDPDSFGSKPYFTTKSGTSSYYKNTKELVKGTRYYYKVRGVREINGKTYYTKWSTLVYRIAQ